MKLSTPDMTPNLYSMPLAYFRLLSSLLLATSLSSLAVLANAQVTFEPAFFGQDETVTLFYDAEAGNGALADCGCDVYLHTGLITSESADASDWQFVATEWATTTPAYKLTPDGGQANLYSFELNIPEFYEYADGTVVEQLAFVFRDGAGNTVGRGDGGADIYYDVQQSGAAFSTRVDAPSSSQNLFVTGENFTLRVSASEDVGSFVVTDNGTELLRTTNENTLEETLDVLAGNHLLRVLATSQDGDTSSVRIQYVGLADLASVSVPAGVEPGYTDLGDGRSAFYLYAPAKERALLRFNTENFALSAGNQMAPTSDGTGFYLEAATPSNGNFVYQYIVDGAPPIADPFSELVIDPFNDAFIDASVFPDIPEIPNDIRIATWVRPEVDFQWQNDGQERPDDGELIVYELLIRDFTDEHSYQSLIDSMEYFKRLGVNAIELMPVNEFEGNLSWGYNPSYHMALDKYYGTPEAFKAFVDAAHGEGISVLVDVVFNHGFGQNPYVQLYAEERAADADGAYVFFNQNARHPFNVGVDANHESIHQQRYTGRILRHMLEEFHLDGFRFDLSKGFTQTDYGDDVGAWSSYDQARIDRLVAYRDTMWAVDEDSYVILEHLGANDEERVLAANGMILWGNMSFAYAQAGQGVTGADLYGVTPQSRGFEGDRLIGYMESHDEQRFMYEVREFGLRRGDYDTKDYSTSLARKELASNFYYTVPGGKMLWQFGEYGYDVPIDFNGRTGDKPIRWDLLQRAANQRLFNVTASLIKLRREYDVFSTGDFDNLRGALGSGSLRTLAIDGDDFDVLVVGNFGLVERSIRVDLPTADGENEAYEYWTGETQTASSTGQTRLVLAPGEYRLYTTQRLPEPQGGYLSDVSSLGEALPRGAEVGLIGNPSLGDMIISVTGWDDAVTVDLFDAAGQSVLRQDLGRVSGIQTVNTGTIPSGVYTVALTDSNGHVWSGLWTRL